MEPTKVLPGLYLGDQRHVADEDVLLDHDITHVISVGKGVYKLLHNWVARIELYPSDYKVDIEDIEHLVLDVLDMEDQDISKYFDKTFTFIEKGRRDGAVLVHWFVSLGSIKINRKHLTNTVILSTAMRVCPARPQSLQRILWKSWTAH